MNKYWITFISGLLSDFWLSACTYCVNHDSFAALVFFNFTYPIVNLIGVGHVLNETNKIDKIKLLIGIGAGYAVGSSVFYLFFRDFLT
jgi:hypothetical protein